jgi:hypothetical protein
VSTAERQAGKGSEDGKADGGGEPPVQTPLIELPLGNERCCGRETEIEVAAEEVGGGFPHLCAANGVESNSS